jgi:hypothetical protein
MGSRRKKTIIAGVCAGAIVLATASAVLAIDNAPPTGTTVRGKLLAGGDLTFTGATINGLAVQTSCASFSAHGVVPSKPSYKVDLSTSPKIDNCSDNLAGSDKPLGGTDTITTNSVNGPWMLKESSAAPYTMTLVIPKAGATFTSSMLPGCVITAAPTAKAAIEGSYDPTTATVSVTDAPIALSGSGCTVGGSATVSATVVLNPNPGMPPF